MKTAHTFESLDYGTQKNRRKINDLKGEIAFTKVYKENKDKHPYIREILCLKEQAKYIFMPIEKEDCFAGRTQRLELGLDPERGDITDAAYFCHFDVLEEIIKEEEQYYSRETKEQAKELAYFWKEETTSSKCRNAYSDEMKKVFPDDDYYSAKQISYPMYGFGGGSLHYDKLLQLGISGLQKEIDEQERNCNSEEETVFLYSLKESLNLLIDILKGYEEQANNLAREEENEIQKRHYERMAEILNHIQLNPPNHYDEAIQLFFIYSLLSFTRNYGRMDVYLGDFLKNDLENGFISEEEAFFLTCGLWKKIIQRTDNFNNRIIIGGRGRRNEAAADLFALLSLKVQKEVHDTIPQLSLRWYNGMKKEIWENAFEALASGSTFPILYNDDVNIPAVEKALMVSKDVAMDYVMYGCGEYVIDHKGIGSPDAALNVLKVLDVTLHNGIDSYTNSEMGLQTGDFESLLTFDDFLVAFVKQLEYQIKHLTYVQDTIYKITGEQAAFPFISLLYDDCIKRRKSVLKGGACYLGGTLESFGNNSAADALYAIKKVIYDEKTMTQKELMECLDRNFEDREDTRIYLKSIDKYGNDINEVDELSVWLNEVITSRIRHYAKEVNLHSFNMVLINNGDSILFGKGTAATADGRKEGEPVSNGNQPGAGNDKKGVTSLLNSMAKLSPAYHAGATHNIRFTKNLLNEKREQCKSLVKAYFNHGGSQIMITVTDFLDLERAMENPSEYSDLIVRVGGYSERFIELPLEVQKEVMTRTLYDM